MSSHLWSILKQEYCNKYKTVLKFEPMTDIIDNTTILEIVEGDVNCATIELKKIGICRIVALFYPNHTNKLNHIHRHVRIIQLSVTVPCRRSS